MAFVTQITATYLLVGAGGGVLLGAGKGVGRQAQGWAVSVAPWWGASEQTQAARLLHSFSRPVREASQSPQGTQGLGGCLALRHWGRESSRSPSPGTC